MDLYLNQACEKQLLWKDYHTILSYRHWLMCFSCDTSLQAQHPPTPVVCYTCNGPLPALKLTLQCEKCGINYCYEHYGNSKCGYTTTFCALLPTCLYGVNLLCKHGCSRVRVYVTGFEKTRFPRTITNI